MPQEYINRGQGKVFVISQNLGRSLLYEGNAHGVLRILSSGNAERSTGEQNGTFNGTFLTCMVKGDVGSSLVSKFSTKNPRSHQARQHSAPERAHTVGALDGHPSIPPSQLRSPSVRRRNSTPAGEAGPGPHPLDLGAALTQNPHPHPALVQCGSLAHLRCRTCCCRPLC